MFYELINFINVCKNKKKRCKQGMTEEILLILDYVLGNLDVNK
jgi:hypothetical protein